MFFDIIMIILDVEYTDLSISEDYIIVKNDINWYHTTNNEVHNKMVG